MFTGDNCETYANTYRPSDDGQEEAQEEYVVYTAVSLGAVLIVIGGLLLMSWFGKHKRLGAPADFKDELEQLKHNSLFPSVYRMASGSMAGPKKPKEMKRSWFSAVERIGEGQFGEVWKGLLKDGGDSGAEFLVAAKCAKLRVEPGFAAQARKELLQEAFIMAQVEPHPHLIAIVGVVTCGQPAILFVTFCEHGSLLGDLRRRIAKGTPCSSAEKYRFASEIAAGMGHLTGMQLVHRDLASRTVLLGSGMVCKIADFSQSQYYTNENTARFRVVKMVPTNLDLGCVFAQHRSLLGTKHVSNPE